MLQRVAVSQVLKRALRQPVVARAAAAPMSTLIEKKEQGEEARYIRSIEAKRQEELRAKMEKIMAMDDSHEDKQELVELLEAKKENKSLVAKLGLNDWKFALPVGFLVGIPALQNEWIIVDAELQVTGIFLLFCATMYTQVGPMVKKTVEEYTANVEKSLREADTVIEGQIHNAIAATELALTVQDDFKQVYELSDSMARVQADVLNQMEQHKYHEAVVKKLDSLFALEEAATYAIRQRMVTSVKSDVVATFAKDAKVKEDALSQAIAVLSGGASAKLGKDIVGDAFAASLTKYKSDYAKQPAGSDPILVQLEKDVAAISAAPVVEGQGGNVYLTHNF